MILAMPMVIVIMSTIIMRGVHVMMVVHISTNRFEQNTYSTVELENIEERM